MYFFSCYLASLRRFITKVAKISQNSQCLHGLFTQLWDWIFYFFEVLVLANKIVVALLMSFLRVLLFTLISYYLFLHLGFCKAHQNCLVATIKITTVLSFPSKFSKIPNIWFLIKVATFSWFDNFSKKFNFFGKTIYFGEKGVLKKCYYLYAF